MAEEQKANDTEKVKPSWNKRRKYMYIVTVFVMTGIGWVLFHDMKSAPADSMVTLGLILLGSIVGSYVFGAVWEDIKLRK